jgi:chemosensory pili system protein ChpA (sensor histidine kinase/response regulator)
MDEQTSFNPQILPATPLDEARAESGARLENYFATPDADALQAVRAALQHLCDQLKRARHDGLAVFCAEVGTVLGELPPVLGMTPLHREVLQRAWSGMEGYLDDLSRGADDVALRLFPQYQELQQLRGLEMAFEQDLFYPDLEVQLPGAVLDGAPPANAPARLKAARSQYQRGLLQWLSQEEKAEALRSMRQAVAEAMRCLPQDRSRALWWAAQGLLECMELQGLPPELDARRLLGRIEQQLRAVAGGQGGEEPSVMREMLYLIGRSRTAGDVASEIRQVYALARYLPAQVPDAGTSAALDDMREQLRGAVESWEKFIQGDEVAAVEFAAHAGQLVQQADKLPADGLKELARQLQDCAQRLDESGIAQALAMEVAMALLVLGQGIAHYRSRDCGEQAQIFSMRLLAKLEGRPGGERQLAQLANLYTRMARDEAVMPLVQEMLANLRQVKVLPAGERSGSQRLLAQVSGGLRMLGQDSAAKLALAVRDGLSAPGEVAVQALAAGLDALEGGVQRLAQGRAPDEAALLAALGGFAGLKSMPAAPVALSSRLEGEEQELLDVFLEEAREVLGDMRANLAHLRAQPGDHETLAIVRRGFHTLKGSGRMVGLNELGEVAWGVERALNRWLQDEKSATPGLLDFIADAAGAFAGWVEELEREGAARIEAEQLLALAARIERGLGPEAAVSVPAKAAVLPPPVVEAPVAVPATAPLPRRVTQPTMLLQVAREEAQQHARALRQHFATFAASHAAPPEFAYAAHAFAEASRALDAGAAVELASALEGWLRLRGSEPAEAGMARLELVEQTVSALEEMARGMGEGSPPQAQPQLVRRLLSDVVPEPQASAVTMVQEIAGMPEVRDDVDAQLLPVFLEEADDLSQKIDMVLRAWHEAPADERHEQALKRLLHTLKGSARMAGAMRIGEIVHGMEDRAGAEAQERSEEAFWEALNGDFDRIAALIEELRTRQAVVGRRAEDRGGRRAGDRAPELGVEQLLSGNLLRVRMEVMDRLVNEAGEISVARARAETELRAFKEGLLELSGSVTRLRKYLRELEIESESRMPARAQAGGAEQFDPLELDRFSRLQELARFMSESVHDVQAVQQSLQRNVDETAAAMAVQAHLGRELQQDLMSVRMVPFASIAERLYRIVRQTAKELNKRANLELSGGGVELDRGVLERMTAPFEHLLRNAIVHGLESEAGRTRCGKPPIGEIRLGLRQENNEVVFELSDDGAGLNFAALREKALARGLLRSDEAVGDERLAQMIFVSGLSTAGELSEVAGRGIGLDVVRSEIASLGGRVEVHSESGQGTRFTIRLPLTLAVAQTLLVRAGEASYAIPSSIVEQVRQVRPAELAQFYAEGRIDWRGRSYPLHYLPRLLGDAARRPESQAHNAVLLLRSGEQCLALHVDELQGGHEAVMKNVGPQLARLPWVAGATVLGNGAVALVLNPARLLQRGGAAAKVVPEAPQARPLVMVVDDSLTVRKVTSRLLERAGYQVATAKDGVDALEQLAELSPAVMLLDIEMPRMDGFELARQLRREPATQNLPIVMITSRAADKHRDHALQLGVNAYLGKPYGEEELLKLIAGYVPSPAVG